MNDRLPSMNLADRVGGLSLTLLGALNLLFVLSFLAISLFAMNEARGETACTGKNLLDDIKANDPAAYAQIEAEAEAIINGKGLLWKIEKDGAAPSFLFGTMHLTDPRVVELTPAAAEAFDAAGTVVIETTEVLDPVKMMAAMVSRPDLTMFTDETTLFSLMTPEDKALVEAALEERGIPPVSVQKMKPWMLAAAISMPACEMARKADGAPFLDIKLARDAEASGKALGGLETVMSQLDAMASLPMELHVEGLVETLRLGSKVDDVFETMIALYEREEIGMIWPLLRSAVPAGENSDAGYAAFEEVMITARNRTMVEHAASFVDEGGAFIAVGALHLPGEGGLIELLRKAGFRVTPAV